MKKVKRKQIDFGGTEQQLVRGDGELDFYDNSFVVEVSLSSNKALSNVSSEDIVYNKTSEEITEAVFQKRNIEWRFVFPNRSYDRPKFYKLSVDYSSFSGNIRLYTIKFYLSCIDFNTKDDKQVRISLAIQKQRDGSLQTTTSFSYEPIRTINGETLVSNAFNTESGDSNLFDGTYYSNAVQDYDGNWYDAVVLGNQVWLAQNLRTKSFNDGTHIEEGDSLSETPAYQDKSSSNIPFKYRGLFYNWYAILNGSTPNNNVPSNIQGLAPNGFHIPSLSEYEQLDSYLSQQHRYKTYGYGFESIKCIASVNYWSQWNSTNGAIAPGHKSYLNNKTGFSVIPTGLLNEDEGSGFYLWTCTNSTEEDKAVYIYGIDSKIQQTVARYVISQNTGATHNTFLPVRCVSDLDPIQFRNWYIQQYGSLQHRLPSDWAQTDNTAEDFIKNKPNFETELLYEEVTYSELTTLISNNNLIKNKKYRITDYVTKASQTNIASANHAFDLIVTAIDVNKLDAKASAVLHAGDTYFTSAGADLSKWEIWYDINNDSSLYDWADTVNGKGVIYRMIDDCNNDCPYDFKNILFTNSGGYTQIYTFNKKLAGDVINQDFSLQREYCYGNIIKPYYNDNKRSLNFNVFRNTSSTSKCISNKFEENCSGNTFLSNAINNVLGQDCKSNFFGSNCINNVFGIGILNFDISENFKDNIIGNYCSDNVFDQGFTKNTLGVESKNNSFGQTCTYNTIGKNFINNRISNNFTNNIIGNNCNNIETKPVCSYNRIGNNCNNLYLATNSISNIIENDCSYIVIGNPSDGYYRNITIASGNNYIKIYNSTENNNNYYLQNVYIVQGCSGLQNSYISVNTVDRNLSYRITVGKDSQGNIRIYNEDDPVATPSAADVHALPDTTKYGASIALDFDDDYTAIADPTGRNPAQEGWFERSGTAPDYVYTLTEDTTPALGKTYYKGGTYIISATLKDQDGNTLGTSQTVDLPLESVVVDGSYNNTTKNVELVLKNGHTITFSVADLVRGLQTEITLQNPLSADLLADGSTNKVYTSTEKTKLGTIEQGAQVNVKSDWNQSDTNADDFIKNKPTTVGSFINDVGYLTAADISASIVWCTYTETDSTNNTGTMSMTISEMQTAIASGYIVCLLRGDLVYTLNSKGTVAARFCCVQGATIHSLAYYDSDTLWHYSSNTLQENLVSGTNIKTINNTSILGNGNINIREIPAANESNNGKMLKVVNGEWTIVPIAPAYHHAGTKTVAQLIPDLLIAANEGNVYNITDTGTTTDYFIEGAGQPIKVGDNVGIAKVDDSYKFDLLSGFVDTSGFALKSEMSITDGTGANADKTTIQLKSGLTKQVLIQHQDISGKADKSEMVITPGTGDDADKVNIQLKSGTSVDVLKTHQDISGKANVNGNYPNMTVGLAQNLDDKVTSEEPFLFRPSPNFKGALGKSVKINEIKGRSSRWNQTGNCGNNNTSFTGSNTDSSVTTSAVSTNFSASEDTKGFNVANQFPNIHVYYVTFDYITNKSCDITVMSESRTVEATSSYVRYEKYAVRPEEPNNYVDFSVSYATEDVWSVEMKNLNIIDVTAIFGTGNEPATKADFQLWLVTNVGLKSFYPYDTGSLLSVKLKEFESIGFNQWDEEWESGTINGYNGNDISNTTTIRSKNYIPVISDVDYFFKSDIYIVVGYTINKEYVAYLKYDDLDKIVTIPKNVFYIRFACLTSYGNVYKNDICISISSSRNGEYEPYGKRTIPFDVTSITGINPTTNVRELVFPNGMRSVGSVYDKIYSDGKEAKAIVNVGSTKIGSLSWNGTTTNVSGVYKFITNSISSLIEGALVNSIGNIICPKYITVSDNSTNNCNVGISVNPYGAVVVYDSNYSITPWLAAMADVPIFYELATPIIYTDLQDENGEPIELPLITKAANGGTERLLPQNESLMEVIAPILNIEYQVDVEDRIDKLEKTIENKLLPTVTAADNGKILIVNDGAWSVESVPVSDSVLH